MPYADDSAKHAHLARSRGKIRRDNIERTKLMKQLESCLCKDCLIGNFERLATGMRRWHVPLITIRCHVPAAGGFLVRVHRAGQHTRQNRGSREDADYQKHTKFGDRFHRIKVY